MKRRSLALPEDLHRRLTEVSERTGAPVAWLVRRALAEAFPPVAEDDEIRLESKPELSLRLNLKAAPVDKPKPTGDAKP